ncbi:hypothetical protein U3A55_08080 [Salarchaeum sp. III]|uniref:hypothetical protein n=1 Tax=Salarchaeum sp. III TaxID=3107927 RepID=UPI002EDAD106
MARVGTERGRRVLAQRIADTTETCADCGFTGTLLGSAWRTSVGRHARRDTTVYRLRCPDCGERTAVELTL